MSRHRVAAAMLTVIAVVAMSSCATVDTSNEPVVTANEQQKGATPAETTASAAEQKAVVETMPAKPLMPTDEEPVAEPSEAVMSAQPAADQAAVEQAEKKMNEAAVSETVPEAAASPTPVMVDKDIPPNTFLVTAAVKNPSHLYYGVGSTLGLVVNGVQGKELVAVRGQTYIFKVDTGVKHDFYLSKSPKGWGAATLIEGVKGNYTYEGVVTFTPDENTPDVVYYACRNHKYMGSKVHVVNKGEESKIVFGIRDDTQPAGKEANTKSAFTSGTQAKQKVMFAEMFISMSPAAKRIDASEHAEAKDMLSNARVRLADAKTALAAGKDTEAIAIVDEALRSMTAASQLVPSESQLTELRAHFEELLKGAHTYEKSYRRNLKVMQKKGKKNLPDLNIEQISKMIVDAQKLADNNQYDDANKLLTRVQHSITGALTELLADETMDYTLSFDSPKEEYEYELSRYKSYEELVPIAIEQKNPPRQTRALMDQFVDKARSTYELSGPKAKEGDYKTAIQMLQGATSHMQRALRIVGVQ